MVLFLVYFPRATPATADPNADDESPPSYRSAVM